MRLDRGYGSPYDRGASDSYYGRTKRPHYYIDGTHNSDEISIENMTIEEIEEYHKGYDENDLIMNWKHDLPCRK